MAVLKLGKSHTFATFSALSVNPSQGGGGYIFQNPAENEQKTIAYDGLVWETKAYSKEALLQLKKDGWSAAIRDKGDGVEIDQLRLSFTESESNQIRLSERFDEVQKIVYDAYNELESYDVYGNKQNGIRWQAVNIHTDTKNIHLDIFRHRHYIDVENQVISRAYQGSSPSEISKVSDKIKQRLIETGIFQENGFEMTGVSQFRKEEKESLIQVSEDIKEGGGFGNKIEDARSLVLSDEAINSIKNQDFIFNVIAEKQKELNDLKQVLVMSQQAAAALIQRDEAIEAQKQAEAQAEAAKNAQKEAEAAAEVEKNNAAQAAIAAREAQEAQARAEKERTDFENRLFEVSAKNEETQEENANLKSDITELESENTLLTQENSGLQNTINTLEKLSQISNERISLLTGENNMLKNTIQTERENAALTKSMLERIQADEEINKQVNKQLQNELEALKKFIAKVNEDAQAIKERNSKLMEKMSKLKSYDNEVARGVGEGNIGDFVNSKEWKSLEYAGAKYDKDSIYFPTHFNELKEPLKTKVAMDICVASQIRWGNDYSVNSENKSVINYMNRVRKENKSLIEARAEGVFKNQDYVNKKRAEKLIKSGISLNDFEKKNPDISNEIKGALTQCGYTEEDIQKGVKVNKEEKAFVIVDHEGDYAIFNSTMELQASNNKEKTKRIESALLNDGQEQDDEQEI